jgi:ParB-like chromosome segregation protein Spo0J
MLQKEGAMIVGYARVSTLANLSNKPGERRKRKLTAGSERRRVAKKAPASSPNPTEPSYKIHYYAPDEINADKPSRPINPDAVQRITEGRRRHGQFSPLTVRVINGVPHLMTGFHRLEAAKKLKLKKVPCFVIRGGKTIARLWQISENLHRAELAVLDEAEQTAEWLKLVEKLAPSQDDDPKKRGPGRPEGLKKKAAKELPLPGKTDAAKQKTLDRRLKIANIDAAARQAARDAGFADSQTKMSQIAREPTARAQLAKVEALTKSSRKTPAKLPGSESAGDEPPLEVAKREFRRAKNLRRALMRLSEKEVRLFLAAILAFVLGKEDDQRDEVSDGRDDERGEGERGGSDSGDDVDDVDDEEDDEERDDGDDEDGHEEGDDED